MEIQAKTETFEGDNRREDSISRLVGFLGVDRSELGKVLLLFSFFFIVIATYWVQKPIRTSKFISAVGVEYLPLAKLSVTFIILPVVFLYSSMIKRCCRECLVTGCAIVFIMGSLIFWYLFNYELGNWVYFAYYIYVDIYNSVMVVLFWSFANDITPPDQARRIYGFVGAGGILGGLVGSALTGWTVQFIGANNLLLVCSGMLTTIVIFSWMLMHQCSLPVPTINRKQPPISWEAAIAGARITLRSPYLIGIAVIVSCYEFVSTIVDYQFSFAVAKLFVQEEALAAFLGKIGSGTVVLAIFIQVIFTTFILRRYGPKLGLLILPVIMGLGSLFFLAFPFFAFAAVLFASDNSLHYSVNQTSKEVLYTPTDEATKYQAKAFIDMFLSRLSKGFSSLIILICNLFLIPFGFQNHYLAILSLIIIIAWVVMVYFAGSRFFELAKNSKN